MELTLNELKILRNALNMRLRKVCLQSPEFDDIKHSLYKVVNEIERIEIDIKAADEAFKAINDILKPKKINHSLNDLANNVEAIDRSLDDLVKTIEAIDSLEYTYRGIEPFIKIEVDYVMLKDGDLETLLSLKDKNKNCIITFK